jgi:trehalose/maltose transport system substrate-binding protein
MNVLSKFLVLVLAVVALFLVGCGSLSQPAASPEPAKLETDKAPAAQAQDTDAPQATDDTLKLVLFYFTTEQVAAYEPLFEQFTAETGLEVEVSNTWGTGEDFLAEMQQTLEAGSNEVDVFTIDVIWPGILAEHAVDLSPYITASELETHIPAILEHYTVDDKLVALPFFADVGLLYYRTDLLAKYGYDGPPATWDELEEMAADIQAGERAEGNDEFWGYVWQGANYEGLTCNALEWQVSHDGGRIIEPDGTITVNNPDTIAAFERAAGWVGTISPPDVIDHDEIASLGIWSPGNAAFMRQWPFAIFEPGDSNDPLKNRFGVTVLPTAGSNRAATLGGSALMVSKYSSRPEAAARLVQLLAGPEGQQQNALTGLVPTIEALYRDPDLLAAQPYLANILPVVQNAVPRPSTVTGAQYAEVSAVYHNHVHRILTGEIGAAEGVANLEAELVDLTGFEIGSNAVAAGDEEFPELIDLPNGFFPEGIAVGRGANFFVGSLLTGAVYGGDLRTGEGALVVPPQGEDRIAVGLAVDTRSNAIFVAGGGPFVDENVAGSAYVYDAETGAELAEYPLSGQFVNDVIITREAAYFTDSGRDVLYRLPLGPGGELPDPSDVQEIALKGEFAEDPDEFPKANGIEATPDGKTLLLVNFSAGKLYRVDPDTGDTTNIEGVSVPEADGLLLDGKTLYVVYTNTEIGSEQVAVVQLDPELTSGAIVDSIASDDFDVPTTVAGFGNALYVVNARYGTDPLPTTEYNVVRVSKR